MYIEFFFESGSHCATQSDLKLTLSASVCLLRLRQATPYLVNMIFSYAQQRVAMIEHTYLSLHVALLLCVATTSKIYSCQKKQTKTTTKPQTQKRYGICPSCLSWTLHILGPTHFHSRLHIASSSLQKVGQTIIFVALFQLCKLNCIF